MRAEFVNSFVLPSKQEPIPFILQTLYESSIAFGMRKALQTEQGKGDMEGRIGTLEADTKDFERQVRLIAVPVYSLTGMLTIGLHRNVCL